MAQVTVTVANPSGLHARPAATFVKAAASFPVDIRITNLSRDPERSVSAKSILGVLQLGVGRGQTVRIAADGDGAVDALQNLVELIESGLGEPLAS